MSKGINNKVCKIDGVAKRAFVGLRLVHKAEENDENAF